ncbi:MAG: hypothetical protein IJD96_11650 [Lachnospiraceae bacterium]|nr:hypothetical protein [Lachnospiraceae bacterium]
MKLVVGIKALVINVKESEFTDREGKAVKTYKVALEQDGEVASLPCTVEVLEKAEALKQNTMLAAYSETEFNGKVTKSLRVIDVVSAK